MPLTQSMSKEAFDSNVAELINAFKQSGRIGSSKPKDKEKARKRALAIAFKIKGGK